MTDQPGVNIPPFQLGEVSATFIKPCLDCGTTVQVKDAREQPHEHKTFEKSDSPLAYAWWEGYDAAQSAIETLTEQVQDARHWARHGYEIGQRSCTWADHGVAPEWLTEGHRPEALRSQVREDAPLAELESANRKLAAVEETLDSVDYESYEEGLQADLADRIRAALATGEGSE